MMNELLERASKLGERGRVVQERLIRLNGLLGGEEPEVPGPSTRVEPGPGKLGQMDYLLGVLEDQVNRLERETVRLGGLVEGEGPVRLGMKENVAAQRYYAEGLASEARRY